MQVAGRYVRRAAVATLVAFAFATPAYAQEVFIAGYTNGCFNCGGAAPNTSATQTATIGGLTYVNSTFSGFTVAGFRALGGNAVAPPIQNVNNLGALSLATTPFVYGSSTFTLRTTFTAPEAIVGGNTVLMTATLTGTVTIEANSGGVFIDFNNTPILFTFNDVNCQPGPSTCGSGSFLFSVNDLSIDPGQLESITGQITAAQQSVVPEPSTYALFAAGLIVLGGIARRRRA